MADSDRTSDPSVAPSVDTSTRQAQISAAREAVDRARARVRAAPTSPERSPGLSRDLAQALNTCGDALRSSGDLTGAHGCYRDAVDIVREHLLKGNMPTHESRTQADPIESEGALAGSEDAGSLSIVSEGLQNIGEVLVAQGDLSGAADALRQSLAFRRRLCEIDRNCEQRRRDVDRSIERLGDVLILKSTLSGFYSDHRPNDASSGRSADHGLARLKAIGDALEARGDWAGALALFREYLETQRKRMAQKPEDAAALGDLTWTLGAVGRVHKAQGDLSAALAALSEALDARRALAARSPSHSARQLDLSFSLMAVGEVLEARADLSGALSAYQEAAALRRQLCEVDPSNNGLRCDLAACLIRIGESLERKADRVGALNPYREALEVARHLSAREPESPQWKEDLSQLQGRIDAIMRESTASRSD